MQNYYRRLPIGAEIVANGVHFRVYAPKCRNLNVQINGDHFPLSDEGNGYFSGLVKEIGAHNRYYYVLDAQAILPDPASRYQPDGPHGASEVVDPASFKWSDHDWNGVTDPARAIIYELHIGTFTEEGSWHAACQKLDYLKELGITIIQMMPIAEFPGTFNWGYDGVDLFAPTHNYGHPDDLKNFINEAHRLGLAVILDVVYNHFGPSGNYLAHYSDDYFKDGHGPWGAEINFDGKNCHALRELLIENAGYWIEEFHFDGLRLDACHTIHDHHDPHILAEIARKVREKGGNRQTFISAENEKQRVELILKEEEGGYGLDAVLVEDFHHAAFVRLRRRCEGYFSDFRGRAQELLSAIKNNFLYQGQWSGFHKCFHGTPASTCDAYHFINFLENHDQVGNTGNADRLSVLCQPAQLRALTALLFFAPQTPLLFQGQEYGSTSPFYFFCEHEKALAEKVLVGRRGFLDQFPSSQNEGFCPPNPNEYTTFFRSKLNWQELNDGGPSLLFYKDLIKMRQTDETFSNRRTCRIDGSVLSEDVFIVRYFSSYGDRLLLFNLGIDFPLLPATDPLLAPPLRNRWKLVWSSEMVRYGGMGYREYDEKEWVLTGCSATVLYPTSL